MRKPLKITSRSSTITNAFVQAILPYRKPNPDDQSKVLAHFGQSEGDRRCVYCGDRATDWDHLEPLVAGKRPSGRTSGLGNMVPACGGCNQSKSGQGWLQWVKGGASNSPKSRQIADLDARIAAIESFQRDFVHVGFSFEDRIDNDLWSAYWRKHDEIQTTLREAQALADRIKAAYPADEPPLRLTAAPPPR